MAATIEVQTTTGSDTLAFAGAVIDDVASVTPNAIPVATRIDVVGDNGDTLRVFGTDLTFGPGIPPTVTGGIVTGLTMLDNGSNYVKLSGFSVDAVLFYNTIIGANPEDVLDLIGDINFFGNDGIDVGHGANGNDDLRGGLADDVLRGLGGNDIIDGGAGGDFMRGGTKIDTLTYERSAAAVTVNLGAGTATGGDATGDNFGEFENLRGSDHNDKLSGNSAANVLEGRDGNDTLRGSGGADTLNGGAGGDTIDYLNSAAGVIIDLAAGTAAGGHAAGDTFANIEHIRGSNSADTLTGNKGNNTFKGQGGDDTLIGGSGKDRLLGGDGNDRLDGGSGFNQRTGGTGADTFVLHKFGTNGDRILDFAPAADVLEVKASEFGGGLAAGTALTGIQFVSNATGKATDNGHRFILNTTNGELWYDNNGLINGDVGSRLITTFDLPAPPLAASDFDIV